MKTAHKIPISLLTGFLGAGKTTLLNFLLRHPQMTGTAVVINEYGAVGIDHHLVEAAPDEVSLIADGCMCCTARGQVAEAMLHLLEHAQRPGSLSLQRMIIETTGLAEPGPIVQQIIRTPELAEHFTLDSVVTLVDALNGADSVEAHDIAVQQVTAADHLLLSKTDLVSAAQTGALESRLRKLNPDAAIRRVVRGAAEPSLLFTGGRHNPASAKYEPGAWFAAADTFRLLPVTQTGMLLASARNALPSDQDIQTFSLIVDEPLSPNRLEGWIGFLRSMCGPTLLRFKGLVNVTGQNGPSVIHGVQKALHPITQLPTWPSADRRTRLVFITRGWGQDMVASTLAYLQSAAPRRGG
jgi:G3E family GTPase